jgi:hypothetical protein
MCQLKMTNVEGDQAPAKWQKKLKNFENSSTKTIVHQLTDTVGISYGVCQEILAENLNMRHIAPSWQRARPHVPENHSVCD